MGLYSFKSILDTLAPFDFSQSLAYLSDFSPLKNEQVVSNNSFSKAVEIKGKTIAFEVTELGNVENPKLQFTAYSETRFTSEIEQLVADRISFFLSLQDDLREFYKIADQDECFKPIIKRFYGHKQVKFLTPFEITCWAILGQRIPMAVAHKMKERLVEKFGGHINMNDNEYRTFPEPATINEAEFSKLLETIHNEKKAEWISGAAKAFNHMDEQWLRTAPYDDVYVWLTNIKGIGEWSANFIMIRGLGRMEKLSSLGPEIATSASKIYTGNDEVMPDQELCEIADKYGQWKGYWAYYLRIYAEFLYVFEVGKKQLN